MLLEGVKEHLGEIPALLGKVGIVVFEFDVKTDLSVSIDDALGIAACVKHLDGVDELLQRDHLEALVKEWIAVGRTHLSLEKLELSQGEVLNVEL